MGMNSLGLEFVVNIDEMIFEKFLPKPYADMVEHCSLVQPPMVAQKGEPVVDEQHQQKTRLLRNWWLRLAFVFSCICFNITYVKLFQSNLPGYIDDIQSHCHENRAAEFRFEGLPCPALACIGRLCLSRNGGFFDAATCFPYGGADGGSMPNRSGVEFRPEYQPLVKVHHHTAHHIR